MRFRSVNKTLLKESKNVNCLNRQIVVIVAPCILHLTQPLLFLLNESRQLATEDSLTSDFIHPVIFYSFILSQSLCFFLK